MDAHSPDQEYTRRAAPIASGLLKGHSEEKGADSTGGGPPKSKFGTTLCNTLAQSR